MPVATEPTAEEINRRVELVHRVSSALGRLAALSLEAAVERLVVGQGVDRKEARSMILGAVAAGIEPGVRLHRGIVEVSGPNK